MAVARPAATAPIRPLAQKILYTVGRAIKKREEGRKRKKVEKERKRKREKEGGRREGRKEARK